MVRPNSGVPELRSRSDLRLVRIAAVGALVAALGLAGCGRKAGLDPPPSAVSDPAVTAEPGAGPEIALGPDGKPMAPASGPKRRTPIDWLLN
jgi:predicted small lipoprotein YifL